MAMGRRALCRPLPMHGRNSMVGLFQRRLTHNRAECGQERTSRDSRSRKAERCLCFIECFSSLAVPMHSACATGIVLALEGSKDAARRRPVRVPPAGTVPVQTEAQRDGHSSTSAAGTSHASTDSTARSPPDRAGHRRGGPALRSARAPGGSMPVRIDISSRRECMSHAADQREGGEPRSPTAGRRGWHTDATKPLDEADGRAEGGGRNKRGGGIRREAPQPAGDGSNGTTSEKKTEGEGKEGKRRAAKGPEAEATADESWCDAKKVSYLFGRS